MKHNAHRILPPQVESKIKIKNQALPRPFYLLTFLRLVKRNQETLKRCAGNFPNHPKDKIVSIRDFFGLKTKTTATNPIKMFRLKFP